MNTTHLLSRTGFTQYAVEVSAGGTAWGRKEIERRYVAEEPIAPRQAVIQAYARYVQSATPYARSRNFFITIHKRRGTMPRSMFVRAILGRFGWPTPIDRAVHLFI